MIGSHPNLYENEESEASNISIYDCLNLFTVEEKLGPDDPWFLFLFILFV